MFISDIRNQDITKSKEKQKLKLKGKEITEKILYSYNTETDNIVIEDLERQRKWVEEIDPIKAHLKFRTPFNSGLTNYFDGDIFLQNWSPHVSAETRLIPKKNGNKYLYKNYDHVDYESHLFYYNVIVRQQQVSHNFNSEILPKKYDSICQLIIISDYFKKILKKEPTKNDIEKICIELNIIDFKGSMNFEKDEKFRKN